MFILEVALTASPKVEETDLIDNNLSNIESVIQGLSKNLIYLFIKIILKLIFIY